MNDFDRAARHAVKADPLGILRWVFPKLSARWRFERWFDAQSAPRPGEPDRRCDTIAELIDNEGTSEPRAVVLELFTDADPDADDRLLEYLGRYRRELRHGPHGRDRYPFLAAMIFLTNSPQRVGWEADLPDERTDEVGIIFKPKLLAVDRESAIATLQAIEDNRLSRGVLAWVSLMQGGQGEEVIARWRGLVEFLPDDNFRKTLIDLVIVFAEKSNSRELWQKGLEGLTMDESTSMREVRDRERLANRKDALLRVLKSRSPQGIPTDLRDKIANHTDAEELNRWFDVALESTDIAAFRGALNI
jgi:hypothetical protein